MGGFLEKVAGTLALIIAAVLGIPALMVGNAMAATWTTSKTDALIGGGLAIGGLGVLAMVLLLGIILFGALRSRGVGPMSFTTNEGGVDILNQAKADELNARAEQMRNGGRKTLPQTTRRIVDVASRTEFGAVDD